MTLPRSLTPDQLRRDLKALESRLMVVERGSIAASVVTGWTDAQPRWVAYPVTFGDFTGAALSVTITIATLPAGVSWTAVWVKPGTSFVSPGAPPDLWRLGVDVPATGATAGGAPKTVDVTTPDLLAQQAAAWYVQCDASGSAAVTATLYNGTDNANTLTAGTATIYLLLSVPGATTDDLPHE